MKHELKNIRTLWNNQMEIVDSRKAEFQLPTKKKAKKLKSKDVSGVKRRCFSFYFNSCSNIM